MADSSRKDGLQTKPALKLSANSGSSWPLPPVVTEICGLGCWKLAGTPSAAQLPARAGLSSGVEHGSLSWASKRLAEPNSSPIDGARKPSAKLARITNSSASCQRRPYLGVTSEMPVL